MKDHSTAEVQFPSGRRQRWPCTELAWSVFSIPVVESTADRSQPILLYTALLCSSALSHRAGVHDEATTVLDLLRSTCICAAF